MLLALPVIVAYVFIQRYLNRTVFQQREELSRLLDYEGNAE